MKSTSLYIEGFDGAGISDGNGINFMVFRTYEGKLRVRNSETGAVFDAIPVPPHGRLIDTNAKVQTQLYDDEHEMWTDEVEMTVEEYLGYCFNKIPTIIPADKGG